MKRLWANRRGEFEQEFAAFYTARAAMIRSTAFLLCGNWHLAEDLTQTTFTKLYLAWNRIERREVIDQYARRVLLRVFLDERRRPWRWEQPTEPGSPELDGLAPAAEDRDERLVIQAALAQLSPRHRAVLVLRFWTDLSVEQVAEILACSEGTVKSQTARGLAKLREVLGVVTAQVARL